MKKLIIISFVFCGFALKSQSKGTRWMDASLGYEANGLFGKVAYSDFYNMKNQFFRFALQFHLETLKFNEKEDFDTQLYVASAEYNKRLLVLDRNENWTIYGGLGVLGGYELVNGGKKYTDDGKEVTYDSNIIYGGTVNIELDRFIGDFSWTGSNKHLLSAFVNLRLNYYQNTDIGEIQPSLSAGLRLGLE